VRGDEVLMGKVVDARVVKKKVWGDVWKECEDEGEDGVYVRGYDGEMGEGYGGGIADGGLGMWKMWCM
ncbi:hypothetical protein, partial [Paenibacillus xylanexedens]|uniref:hypothetical protein n=1 Tax=Paenibacillus xylanexedens TaxID=528191 RepID=UPI003F7AEEB0